MWRTWLQNIRKIPMSLVKTRSTNSRNANFYVRYDYWDTVSCSNSDGNSVFSLDYYGDSAIDVSGDYVKRSAANTPIDWLRSSALRTISNSETELLSRSTDCLLDDESCAAVKPKRQRSYEVLDVPEVDVTGNIIRSEEKVEPRQRKRSQSISSIVSHPLLSASLSVPAAAAHSNELKVTPVIKVDEWDKARTFPRSTSESRLKNKDSSNKEEVKPVSRRLLAPITNMLGSKQRKRSKSRLVTSATFAAAES